MASMRMSKEEYDKLYFYTSEHAYQRVLKGDSPLNFTSPRRYQTIDECRKAALSKSKKDLDEIKVMGRSMSGGPGVHVFKGTKYLGCVEYDAYRPRGAAHVGLWYAADHPRDAAPIYKDGSITAPMKPSTPAKPAPKKPSEDKSDVKIRVVNGKFAPVNGFTYPKTVVKDLVKSMETVYAKMYAGQINEDNWVADGDRMLKKNPNLVAAVAVERQDLLTSDREIAAFAYAVQHMNAKDRAKLLAMDDKSKAPTKKPASKRTQATFDRGW